MTLHPDWRRILRRAWSIRMIALAGVLSGCEAVVNAFDLTTIPLPQWVKALIVFTVIAAAFVARLVAQRDD